MAPVELLPSGIWPWQLTDLGRREEEEGKREEEEGGGGGRREEEEGGGRRKGGQEAQGTCVAMYMYIY